MAGARISVTAMYNTFTYLYHQDNRIIETRLLFLLVGHFFQKVLAFMMSRGRRRSYRGKFEVMP